MLPFNRRKYGRCLEIFKRLDGYSIPHSTPKMLINFLSLIDLIFSFFRPFLSLNVDSSWWAR
jgi:hypothetical protein